MMIPQDDATFNSSFSEFSGNPELEGQGSQQAQVGVALGSGVGLLGLLRGWV